MVQKGWVDKPKGLRQVLWERGWIDENNALKYKKLCVDEDGEEIEEEGDPSPKKGLGKKPGEQADGASVLDWLASHSRGKKQNKK